MTAFRGARAALLGAILFAAWSGAAWAGGVNLGWNDCGQAGLASRSSACTNNALAGTLYCSAKPPALMPKLNGQTCTVDVQTTGSALSPWWQMGYTGCRPTGLSCSMDFMGNSTCSDPWLGAASSGANYNPGFGGPNRARLRGTGAVPQAVTISPSEEWYICKLTISGVKTAGAGSCDGCRDGACFSLTEVFLTQPVGVGDYHITSPLDRQCVSWQATGASVPFGCQGSDTSRKTTWGAVKSIYK